MIREREARYEEALAWYDRGLASAENVADEGMKRHARHELADRAVGAHAQARRRERVAEVVAQAAQHLQLEVAVLAAA